MAVPAESQDQRTSPSTSAARRRPFRRMLVAADSRYPGSASLPALLQFVHLFDAEMVICHVVMRPTSVAGNELDGNPANPEETGILQELRLAVVREFGSPGRDLPIKILHGDPGQRICEYAEFADCDVIVLGPREKASLAKALRGSVSKYVVGNTRRHVLVLGP
jgi:nucleotide-binding universal stress UspA family protein